MHPIRILVAALNDRLPDILCDGIARDPTMRLVRRCDSFEEAADMAGRMEPDVIALDLRLSGREPLKAIAGLSGASRAAVVALGPSMGIALQAVHAGAVDFIHLPVRGSESDCRLFAVDAVSRLKVATLGRVAAPAQDRGRQMPISLIAVYAAQGGLVQLACLLNGLPLQHPPVLVLQRSPGLCGDFNLQVTRMCGRAVEQAADGRELSDGMVFLADCGRRAGVEPAGGRLILRIDNAIVAGGVRADDYFQALAEALGSGVLGVSMSGEGELGLGAVSRAGGVAILYHKNALLGQPGVSRGGILEMPVEDMAGEVTKWLQASLSAAPS